MKRIVALIFGIACLLAVAPPAAAQEADVQLTIEALDECPEGQTFCLEVVEGDSAELAPGVNATVTFRNSGGMDHNLYVANLTDANETHNDTSSDVALASTSVQVANGTEENITFLVPDNSTGLYFWCDVVGHEEQGMWLEAPFAAQNDTFPTQEPTPPPEDENETGPDQPFGPAPEEPTPEEPIPAPGILGILLAAAAVVLARSHRRRRDE